MTGWENFHTGKDVLRIAEQKKYNKRRKKRL